MRGSIGPKRSPETKSGAKFSGGRRVRVLVLFLVVASGIIGGRLFFLQVLTHDKWVALAENQHNLSQALTADRGEIYIHDGSGIYPVAINREYQMAYAVPKVIVDPDHTALALSGILGLDVQALHDKLARPDDPFEILKKRLSDDEVSRIKAGNFPGIALLPEEYRYYPGGELASQVVGFASLGDTGGAGGYGVEASQDSLLRGTAGTVSLEKDAGGRWIPFSDKTGMQAENGDKLVLTLDRVIQYETEKTLADAVKEFDAERATAIVLDPKTGAVLAMASVPQFDPNNYSKVDDFSLFMNPATSFTFEPGSVMKPITMAMGIDEGKVAPDTEFTDTGSVTISGRVIKNSEDKVYGRCTMTKVLEQSINTGAIYVEKQIGNPVFRDSLQRFGFGSKSGIGLPAELPGNLRNLDNPKADIEFYTASFGQGISVTPLQLADAYAALANGGRLMRPKIVDQIIHPDGSREDVAPVEVRQAVNPETSQLVGQMLRSVVTNGHGKKADVPGYLVAGKTGTAQVARSDGKGYEDGKSIGSFAGYAPLGDPRFVVVVKIDNPKAVQWAESSAAPTFGKIMKFLLEYAKVKPTEESVVPKH